jgi:hypothetical protein
MNLLAMVRVCVNVTEQTCILSCSATNFNEKRMISQGFDSNF